MPRSSNLDLVYQPTKFVGRETELNELKHYLMSPECHLVTLVGVGGIGKTRLAIRLAVAIQHAFVDGVWFVNLQPVQSSKQVVSTLMDAVGLVPSGLDRPKKQLLQYLQDKQMLILFDNFEHLSEASRFLTEIIQRAPAVRLLVTSRTALGLPEEWLYPLRGLPTPPSHQVDNIEAHNAVALFVERARQVRPDFSLSDNRASVVRICQLVEGLPLAIEMAASWTKTLRCSEIVAEIQENMTFLTLDLRHVPERHRSMQAVLDQSWRHLSDREQTLFKHLSIFKDGFRREAAESIAGASLPLLSSLLDQCLIRRQANGRYQIHELLRQYAHDKLAEGESDSLAEAHSHYYCEYLAERTLGTVEGAQVETSVEIEEELENVRAAWNYALEHHLLVPLKNAAAPYFYFCQLQSRYLESAEASGRAAEVLEAAGDVEGLAQVLVYQGWMLIRIGQFEKAACVLDRSRDLFEELSLIPAYGMGSHPLSPRIILTIIQGNFEDAVEAGEKLKRESMARGDKHNLSFACYGLASAYLNLGKLEDARNNAAQAVQLAEEIGNHWFSGYCYIELGNVQRASGHEADAERHYAKSLEIKKQYRDPEGIAVAARHLGEMSLRRGDYQAAREQFEKSLSLYRQLNDQGGLATAYHSLGRVEAQSGAAGLAAQHFREALDIADRINFLPLQLSVLLDAGALMVSSNCASRGAELLHLVCEHPSSTPQQQEEANSRLTEHNLRECAPPPDFRATIMALKGELQDFAESQRMASESSLIDPLTNRELDVLRLISQGFTNPQIAEVLVISVGTVKAHTNRIYRKLGVTNRVEAVNKAQALALLGDRP